MNGDAITPLVLGNNNVWPFRVDGRGWVLVDAGIDAVEDGAESWDALVAQARAIGCDPGEVRAVIVTHEHIDHAGLAARWAREGAAIVALPEAAPTLVAGRAAYDAARERRVQELAAHGCPPEVLQVLAAQQAVYATPGRGLRWEPCPADAIVEARDGDTFALEGGRALHVIAAPGHTRGNLVVFVADAEGATSGDLCSGDTLLPTTVPTPGLQFPGLPAGDVDAPRWPSLPPFVRSVERLRALQVRRILPGHGAIVDQPRRLFDQFADHHARRGQRVRAHLALAGAAGDTAHGVVRGLFPRLPAARVGQAMTEAIGHLDLLVECGDATWERAADGVWRAKLRGPAQIA